MYTVHHRGACSLTRHRCFAPPKRTKLGPLPVIIVNQIGIHHYYALPQREELQNTLHS